jgi:hypothetical protein
METQEKLPMQLMVENNAHGQDRNQLTHSHTLTQKPIHGGKLTSVKPEILSTSMSITDLTAAEKDLPTIKSELETMLICLKTQPAQEPTPVQ